MTLSQMNDDTITSDFHFLEDVVGQVEASRRAVQEVGGGLKGPTPPPLHHHKKTRMQDGNDTVISDHPLLRATVSQKTGTANATMVPRWTQESQVHPKWRHWQQQALSKHVNVIFMPRGMQRRKTNKSHVKNKLLHWTVEFVWHAEHTETKLNNSHPSNTKRWNVTVDETCTLENAWKKALPLDLVPEEPDLLWANHSLLIKRLPCPANAPLYNRLEPTFVLADALRDMTVMEYPTIEMVPKERLADFPCAVQDVSPMEHEEPARIQQP